jgi:hypothetical protein
MKKKLKINKRTFKKVLWVRVSEEEYEKVLKIAKKNYASVAEVCRAIFDKYLK